MIWFLASSSRVRKICEERDFNLKKQPKPYGCLTSALSAYHLLGKEIECHFNLFGVFSDFPWSLTIGDSGVMDVGSTSLCLDLMPAWDRCHGFLAFWLYTV